MVKTYTKGTQKRGTLKPTTNNRCVHLLLLHHFFVNIFSEPLWVPCYRWTPLQWSFFTRVGQLPHRRRSNCQLLFFIFLVSTRLKIKKKFQEIPYLWPRSSEGKIFFLTTSFPNLRGEPCYGTVEGGSHIGKKFEIMERAFNWCCCWIFFFIVKKVTSGIPCYRNCVKM